MYECVTDQQKRILLQVTKDKSNAEIAEILNLKEAKVKQELAKLMYVFNVKSRAGLACKFLKEQI